MKIWAKTEEFSEGKYLVVRRDGTTPIWPHFVVGGFDPCAAVGLRAYADEARRRDFDPAYCDSITELADDFEKLSATPRAVAVADPDAPPHRRDVPEVIAMMRRETDVSALVSRIADLESQLSACREDRADGVGHVRKMAALAERLLNSLKEERAIETALAWANGEKAE